MYLHVVYKCGVVYFSRLVLYLHLSSREASKFLSIEVLGAQCAVRSGHATRHTWCATRHTSHDHTCSGERPVKANIPIWAVICSQDPPSGAGACRQGESRRIGVEGLEWSCWSGGIGVKGLEARGMPLVVRRMLFAHVPAPLLRGGEAQLDGATCYFWKLLGYGYFGRTMWRIM